MFKDTQKNDRVYNLLVYGVEKVNVKVNASPIESRNFKLSFEPFTTSKKFNEFDGVITFQGIFESYRWINPSYSHGYYEHTYEKNQLDKRVNELKLLAQNGGFVCFLLNRPFIDEDGSNNFRSTDLAKIACNSDDITRKDYAERRAALTCKLSEFNSFISLHGGANTRFYFKDHEEFITIAAKNNDVVGFILWEKFYFIPTLIPEHNYEEYFITLAEALISSWNKLIINIPSWIKDIKISNQIDLEEQKEGLTEQINEIDHRLDNLSKFKMILTYDSERLVHSVENVLKNGFGIKVDNYDEYREDLKIIDENNNPTVFIEVKGTNSGIKREHVNQVDSHRERAGLNNDFPGLLIINTNIKNARNVDEKDKAPPDEQIKHATKLNVLIIRTLDLLNLLDMYLKNKIEKDAIESLFKTNNGWLHVTNESYEIVHVH